MTKAHLALMAWGVFLGCSVPDVACEADYRPGWERPRPAMRRALATIDAGLLAGYRPPCTPPSRGQTL